jgi:hypothetical protein
MIFSAFSGPKPSRRESWKCEWLAAEPGLCPPPSMGSLRPKHSCLASWEGFRRALQSRPHKNKHPTSTPTSCPLQKTNNNTALFTKHKGNFLLKIVFFFSYFILAALIKERMTFKLSCLKHKHVRTQVLKTFSNSDTFLHPSPKKVFL